MKHLVIVNPKSFAKESGMLSVIADIRTYFKNAANADYTIYISRYPRDAIGVVNDFIKSANEIVRVYSVGGDGILYDCLNGLVGLPNAELAVIPYGKTDDFVRAFGEGKNKIFRDIKKQATANAIPTDIISIGNRYALNFCSAGFAPAVELKYDEMNKTYPLLVFYKMKIHQI